MKKFLFFSALALNLSFAAFAGNPKTDVKPADPATTENKSGTAMYWYKVSYASNPNGEITSSASLDQVAEQSEVDNICGPGNNYDCLRGFEQQLTVFPNTDLTAPSIRTNTQPQ